MSYLNVLHDYFNRGLRNQLNYRELYNFPVYNTEKSIIFFKKDTSPYFDLKDLLINNKDLVSQLKIIFKDILSKHIDKIREIKLLITESSPDIGIGIIAIQSEPVPEFS